MNPRPRPWLAALSMLALLFGLTAGPLLSDARAQDEPIELRVWDQFTDPTEIANAEAIYAAFMEQNPNITVTREVFQTQQMQEVANTAIASGTGPDVIFYDAGPASPACWPKPDSSCRSTTTPSSTAGRARRRARRRGHHARRHALRHAVADRPDRHVLQPDACSTRRARAHHAR